jgi:phenylacetate-CoA ligase
MDLLPATRAGIERIQLNKLRMLLRELAGPNPFWTSRLEAAGLTDGISSLDDFRRLPLTTKQELVDDQNAHPPYGTNLTVPLSRYVRLHQTSGTTGRPMRWLDTADSWDWFMRCWSQIYAAVGMGPEEVVAFPFSFGPFIGFWAAFDAAVRRGYRCLPLGGLSTETRLDVILENRATTVCCTPTYALRMTEAAAMRGIDLRASAVRRFIFAGEPGAALAPIRKTIDDAWGARVFDHWGMTDVGSLGIEDECEPQVLRILESECIAEVIDPENQAPVAPGELGELIITNLGRIGQPVLRYRTGDLVRSAVDPAPDGSALLRLPGGILGRSDDMVVIRGNNVFPSSIDALLRELPEIVEYRATVRTVRAMPHLSLEVEPRADAGSDLQQRVERRLKDRLGFHIEVQIAAPETLPRFEMKARRFVRVTESGDP